MTANCDRLMPESTRRFSKENRHFECGKRIAGCKEIVDFFLQHYEMVTALDVGCGGGTSFSQFASKGIRLLGVDLLPEHLVDCDNYPDVRYCQCPFLDFVCDERFEGVYTSHTVEHFADTEAFLRHFFSFSIPNGAFCIVWPPSKDNVVSGHVHVFTAGLMLYNLVRLGIDCRQVTVARCGYCLAIMGRYQTFDVPELTNNEGDIDRLSKYFPFAANQGFDGNCIPGMITLPLETEDDEEAHGVSNQESRRETAHLELGLLRRVVLGSAGKALHFARSLFAIPRTLQAFHDATATLERYTDELASTLTRLQVGQYGMKYGERQVSPRIDGIRVDHRARYSFATERLAGSVLDIACGVGYGSWILAQSPDITKVTAVDIDSAAISYAGSHYQDSKIVFNVGDAMKLPFPPSTFDAVVSFETIEHLSEGADFLRLLAELVKPGGTLICSTPNQCVLPFDPQVFPYHVCHYTPEGFNALLEDAGWGVRERFSQPDPCSAEVTPGWDGKYNIAVCRRSGGPVARATDSIQ